ncbi:MAG: GerMN domain-containing protein [Thermodesulfobacteriota bacterium]
MPYRSVWPTVPPGRFAALAAAMLFFALCGFGTAGNGAVCRLFADTGDTGASQTGRQMTKSATDEEQSPVYLYFTGADGWFLTGEACDLEPDGAPAAFCRRIIEELIDGPQTDLIPTMPARTKLRAVYLDDRQTAYVDLSREIRDAHPGGVRSELLTVYSIVNTLTLNVDEVERVKLLVNGGEAQTLAGHVDIRYPQKAHMLLVR